jgi:hypothetical protein
MRSVISKILALLMLLGVTANLTACVVYDEGPHRHYWHDDDHRWHDDDDWRHHH